MKTIWKFMLAVTDVQDIEMPRGAEILCVQSQGHAACLWAKVDPNAGKEKRRVVIHGTGHTFEEYECRYIGTFQASGGMLIFHVFEALGA